MQYKIYLITNVKLVMLASYCRSILNSKPTNRNEIQLVKFKIEIRRKKRKDNRKKGEALTGPQPTEPAQEQASLTYRFGQSPVSGTHPSGEEVISSSSLLRHDR
jgi:hypothetical protein